MWPCAGKTGCTRLPRNPLGSYLTLASHGSGLRFARNGAGAPEWQAALTSRSLEPLQTRIEWFRIEAR